MYNNINFPSIIKRKPQAAAIIKGSADYPMVEGVVRFYQTKNAVLVASQFSGLPKAGGICEKPIFAFHIHSGNSCSGNEQDYFADALTHYNPSSCPHPYHAGDMPPMFGCDGVAFSMFLTDRFSIEEIIGKTIIVHANPDDFKTQPSGDSGTKIACGVIKR